MAMVIHLFPGWVNAGEKSGSKLVKNTPVQGVNAGDYLQKSIYARKHLLNR
jgi:hypothetical protein